MTHAAHDPTVDPGRPSMAVPGFAQRPRADATSAWRRVGLALPWSLLSPPLSGRSVGPTFSGYAPSRSSESSGLPTTSSTLTADVEVGTPAGPRRHQAVAERRSRSCRVVDDVSVERVWPHTVRITVDRAAGGRRSPDAGDSLAPRRRRAASTSPRRRRPPDAPAARRRPRPAAPDERGCRLAVVAGCRAPWPAQVASIRSLTPDDVRLRLRSARSCCWGDASAGSRRRRSSRRCSAGMPTRYDVRAPDTPHAVG